MKRKSLQVLSLAMAATMAFGIVAVPAFAEDDTDANVATEVSTDGEGGFSSGFSDGMPPGGSSAEDIVWSSTAELNGNATIDNATFSSSVADENALLVAGDVDVTLTNITVSKSGDSSGGDDCNFYGINSGIMVKDGANVSIANAAISTDATGANGVFSYGGNGGQNGAAGDGTTVTISDSTIRTSGDNAGGIMTTGGGITYANDLDIITEGRSSAAIRTDRGGGEVYVDGGSYLTNGSGSPAIYSTATIEVQNATLESTDSEGVVIEGKNSVSLVDCELIADNESLNGNSKTHKAIMIYQSMSGDAESGTSAFVMVNGSLTNKVGDIFFVTDTACTIDLTNVSITNEDTDSEFLRIEGNSVGWGTTGANGGDVALTASNQTIEGNITVDSISSLVYVLKDNSSYSGAIFSDASEDVSEIGTVDVTIEEGSTWTLTGDSYVSTLDNQGTIVTGDYTLYVNGVAYSQATVEEETTATGSETSTTVGEDKTEVENTSGTETASDAGTTTETASVKTTKAVIKKLISRSSGKLSITLTRKNTKVSIDGYIIKYKKAGASKWTTVKVSASGKTTKTISNLISGKTYKVKVRTYKTVNGTTYKSAWTNIKTVKVK